MFILNYIVPNKGIDKEIIVLVLWIVNILFFRKYIAIFKLMIQKNWINWNIKLPQ